MLYPFVVEDVTQLNRNLGRGMYMRTSIVIPGNLGFDIDDLSIHTKDPEDPALYQASEFRTKCFLYRASEEECDIFLDVKGTGSTLYPINDARLVFFGKRNLKEVTLKEYLLKVNGMHKKGENHLLTDDLIQPGNVFAVQPQTTRHAIFQIRSIHPYTTPDGKHFSKYFIVCDVKRW